MDYESKARDSDLYGGARLLNFVASIELDRIVVATMPAFPLLRLSVPKARD
jgi:hypothetical protein